MPSEWNGNNYLPLKEFSNEIDDLPPPNTYVKKIMKTPCEIAWEIERSKEAHEAEFRRWLIKNKPKQAVMTPIETSTAIGVPDIFCCLDGDMSWVECKILMTGPPRFRGTQYSYLKKLVAAGGKAKIAVQKLSNKTYKPTAIYLYDAEKIVAIPSGMFKQQGEELIFPPGTEPWYKWDYGRSGEDSIEDFYMRLLLDINKFI